MKIIDPNLDGITHINVYSGSRTELDNGTYVSAECLTSELPYTAYAAPYTSGIKSYMPFTRIMQHWKLRHQAI